MGQGQSTNTKPILLIRVGQYTFPFGTLKYAERFEWKTFFKVDMDQIVKNFTPVCDDSVVMEQVFIYSLALALTNGKSADYCRIRYESLDMNNQLNDVWVSPNSCVVFYDDNERHTLEWCLTNPLIEIYYGTMNRGMIPGIIMSLVSMDDTLFNVYNNKYMTIAALSYIYVNTNKESITIDVE
jgi:hypothetical protein